MVRHMQKGLVLIAIIISVVITPSLVAGQTHYTIKVWTDKSSYLVGEIWTAVFWDPKGPCLEGQARPTGSLEIIGPSAHTNVALPLEKLWSGTYTPLIGNPWVAADIGAWNLTLTLTGAFAGGCNASGKTSFQVVKPQTGTSSSRSSLVSALLQNLVTLDGAISSAQMLIRLRLVWG